MSVFDPQAFMQEQVDAPMETSFTPVPEGDYTAVISQGDKYCQIRTTDKGQVLGDILWEILDEQVKSAMGMETVTCRQSLFLDVTDQGKLDYGKNKNVSLGRLREALGMNKPGPWSLTQLRGAGPATITVIQRVDRDDPTKIYNDVKAVHAPGVPGRKGKAA